ncbi:hypothetical protein BV898_02672 [Hypsibius exemplaris]|uniref:EGF-like domain-containing protein n=1 Tax=Hypsibius exemplaris TaxID=2072580 RepID=A0A1W0X7S9_HYPEX|nr:hypothetical protein BV898_02672 [Hypsibius exemplaris]
MLKICLGLLALSAVVYAHPYASTEPEAFLERHARSIEGQTCSNETDFRCNLAYTKCNQDLGICECDARFAVSMQMPLFPEVRQCIPYDYVNLTGLCVPTSPDICSILTPGSFCDVSKRDGSSGKMKCACKIGGIFPNCEVRVGSLCRDDATCLKDIPDSFCGNITNGHGKCTCGTVDEKGFVSNRAGTACKATNCAAKPCRGDPTASTCHDSNSGFECVCNNNTKGRTHDFATEGICCSEDKVTCHDFSKCIHVTDLCNGVSDCDDCSDEMQLYCTGALPKNNPRCFRNFPPTHPAPIKTFSPAHTASVPVVIQPNTQASLQAAQTIAQSGVNAVNTMNQPGANRGGLGYSPYTGILQTNVPTVGIPAVPLPGF